MSEAAVSHCIIAAMPRFGLRCEDTIMLRESSQKILPNFPGNHRRNRKVFWHRRTIEYSRESVSLHPDTHRPGPNRGSAASLWHGGIGTGQFKQDFKPMAFGLEFTETAVNAATQQL